LDWEKFRIQAVAGEPGWVTLQSFHGTFVGARAGGSAAPYLMPHCQAWEHWRLCFGSLPALDALAQAGQPSITLQSQLGTFLGIRQDGNLSVCLNTGTPFTLSDCGDGWVALRVPDGRYLGANNPRDKGLKLVDHCLDWEKFSLQAVPGKPGWVSLRSFHSTYLGVREDGPGFPVLMPHCLVWEQWRLCPGPMPALDVGGTRIEPGVSSWGAPAGGSAAQSQQAGHQTTIMLQSHHGTNLGWDEASGRLSLSSAPPVPLTVVHFGSGWVALRTPDGRHIGARSNRTEGVFLTRLCEAWEQFKLQAVPDKPGWVSLQSIHGTYLGAMHGDPAEPFLMPHCLAWEHWRLCSGAVLALDVGGTRVKCGLGIDGAPGGSMLCLPAQDAAPLCPGPAHELGARLLSPFLSALADALPAVGRVAIGTTGDVYPMTQVLAQSYNLSHHAAMGGSPPLRDVDLRTPISTRLGLPVSSISVMNDAVPAAAWLASRPQSVQLPALCMVLGTGVAISVLDRLGAGGSRARVVLPQQWGFQTVGTAQGAQIVHHALGVPGRDALSAPDVYTLRRERFTQRLVRSVAALTGLYRGCSWRDPSTPHFRTLLVLGGGASMVLWELLESGLLTHSAATADITEVVREGGSDEEQQRMVLGGVMHAHRCEVVLV